MDGRNRFSLLTASLAFLPLWIPQAQPTVTLRSPANGTTINQTTVTFQVEATDPGGLSRATLYVGEAARTVAFSGPAQCEDAEIQADNPTANYGGATSINVDGLTPHAHGLIRFPTLVGDGADQVPQGSTIVSATLGVRCSNVGNTMQLYRLTHDWVETQVTWNQAASGVAWPEPGADGTGSHDTLALSADCSATGWRTFDITTFVQQWAQGAGNFGLVLKDSGADGVDFDSSESATPPVLTVTYLPPWTPLATQTLSGTSAQLSFTTTLEDQESYRWNCLVQGVSEVSWAPTTWIVTVDSRRAPDVPRLVAPANGSTVADNTVDLSVAVSDPDSTTLSVDFYGRTVGGTAEEFTLAVLPDTQKYVLDANIATDIFALQTTWLRNSAAARKIAFVTHEGDIVDVVSDLTQWQRANAALSILDGVLPYGLLPGNHDQPTANYNSTFPFSRYQGLPWYGGHYGSDNDNNYQFFSAGGMEFLVLHLEYRPSPEVIAWANGVLATHAQSRAIITTHAYLDSTGARWDPVSNTSMEYLWTDLVVPNPNVFLVLCGHVHTELRRSDLTPDGRLVHQLLADFQDYPNGGDGWLRLLRFVPLESRIVVQTYSPYLDQYQADAESSFTLDVPMGGFTRLGTATVPNVSTATLTWPGLAANRTHEWYAVVTDPTGLANTSPGWTFTTGTDTTPPVIQSVLATEVTATSARITWTTDEPASSSVEYWINASNPSTPVADGTLTTVHSLTLTGLQPATTYGFRVVSADAAHNSASADGGAFTTLEPVYRAVAAGNPSLVYGTLGGSGFAATHTADGLVQTITEAAAGIGGASSLDATYTLWSAALPETLLSLELRLTASWTSLDADDGLHVFLWNFSSQAWEEITSDIADGTFSPANAPGSYLSALGEIKVRFRDTVARRKEGKDVLSIDQLSAEIRGSVQLPLPPVANDDTATTAQGTAVTIPVLANDTDPNGDVLTVVTVTPPTYGDVIVNPDGTILYSPPALFTGQDSFSYTVSDGNEGADTAEVTVQVTAAPTEESMSVTAVSVTLTKAGKSWKATANVTVASEAGVLLLGATVTGNWLLNGALLQSGAIGTTDASGVATLASPTAKAASGSMFTFEVTGISLTGFVWDQQPAIGSAQVP